MSVFQWKGSIQLGAFIAIPVQAKAAVKTEDIAFQMLHDSPECAGGAGYTQDWHCKGCGEKISRSDTRKGWQGKPVDKEYLDSLKAEKSSVIELDGLVPAEQIDPRYYETSYDITPAEGGEKAYVLLQKLLERSGRVAVGKAVMRDREQIVTIRPRDGILALETMYWPEDLTRAGRDQAARERIKDVEVSAAELALGDQLVTMLAKDFDPANYQNVYAQRVLDYLKTVEDGTVAPPAPKPVAASGGLDLLAALQAAIAASGKEEAAVAAVA
jgi:DNA end-binding protein Ku